MAIQIQFRRDAAADWTANDPTLAEGEIGCETDTGKFKIGDGSTAWTALDYSVTLDHTALSNIGTNTHTQIDTAITASTNHIADVTGDPHNIEADTLTFTNKSISLTTNTLTGSKAEFDTACTDGNFAYSGGAFHDGFSDFEANEHIDWSVSQAPTVIHADNYTDTNTQLSEADITTMGFTKDVEVDWTADQSPAVINAANYTNTTYVSSDFTHDDLTGYEANEHIDWTSDQGATNIHQDNLANSGNWDTAYGWGDWSGEGFLTAATVEAEVDHTNIANIGSNTHAQIDTAITASTNHIADNTQAHSDYLLNSEADTGVGLTLTGDNSSADTAYVPMVLYNTDDTPPAASGFPVGTIYVQYTA